MDKCSKAKKSRCRGGWFFIMLFCLLQNQGAAQKNVILDDQLNEHIFTYDEIEIFRDTVLHRGFDEILGMASQGAFQSNLSNTPQVTHPAHADWFRIKISGQNSLHKKFILEFFDQTIDDLTVFIPLEDGSFRKYETGDMKPFSERGFQHKNFTVFLPDDLIGEGIYYFRVRSQQVADIIIVLRSVDRFVRYALDEYLIFGIFYGMILVFSFYNILMFLAIRQEQYLYYVLYILSVGLFEMCVDGLAYQYLWPGYPEWNQYAYGIALFGVSIFALQFSRSLLFTRRKAPVVDKVLVATMVVRSLFFIYCLFLNKGFFNYKFLELIPLAMAFYAGIHIYSKGYRPARYFVWGYAFLALGFIYKLLIMLHVEGINFGIISYYSLSICFVIEMLFLSFALGDKVRVLKMKKDKMQGEMIRQMKLNASLKDSQNERLEREVADRTREVREQAQIIAVKNAELTDINQTLAEQAEEIQRMNHLLKQDNSLLKSNVEEVTRARVLSVEVDFEEFSKIYPDHESCLLFLEKLKEKRLYKCYKCGNDHYYQGHLQGSRRCSKCSYEESVTAHTLLQNTRIPINKAFYIVFLVYSTNGKISSYKLSEILSIRQSTCWAYSSRIKKAMLDRKRRSRVHHGDELGWASLLFED